MAKIEFIYQINIEGQPYEHKLVYKEALQLRDSIRTAFPSWKVEVVKTTTEAQRAIPWPKGYFSTYELMQWEWKKGGCQMASGY